MATTGTLGAVPVHDQNCLAAEQARQQAADRAAATFGNRAGSEPIATEYATLRQSDINYYRAVKASCIANGLSPSAAISALIELGTGGL
jgi:hypothetical protein